MKFFGVYVTTNQGGFSRKVATEPRESSLFPPTLDHNGLTYRFVNSYQVASSSHEAAFRAYCQSNHIETDIPID